MYGWRSRIGLLVPSGCITMEPELYKMAPEGVTIHTSRMLMPSNLTVNSLLAMTKEVERATRALLTISADIVIFGCTSGSLIEGSEHNKTITNRIKKTLANGKPALTTSTAVIEALQILKAKKIAVATPYSEELNRREKRFLEENGFVVTNIKGLGFSEFKQIYPLTHSPVSMNALQEPYVAYKLAIDANTDDADCIFISCTNLRTIEILEKLERDTGKPVISSNQATFAIALREVGVSEPLQGYGKLFELL